MVWTFKEHVAHCETVLGQDKVAKIRALSKAHYPQDPERVADLFVAAAHKWGYREVLSLLIRKASKHITE